MLLREDVDMQDSRVPVQELKAGSVSGCGRDTVM
jgi:hypothetical protein